MSDAIRNDPPRRPTSAPQPPVRGRDAGAARPATADVDARIRADAQTLASSLAELDAAALIQGQRSGAQGDGSEEGGQSSQQQPQDTEGQALQTQPLDHRLARLGHFVTHVHHSAQGQGSWSLSLPLDAELLPDTVLHLGYAPTLVTLHFETRDWTARELLAGRTQALEGLVRQLLPPGCDVVVSV